MKVLLLFTVIFLLAAGLFLFGKVEELSDVASHTDTQNLQSASTTAFHTSTSSPLASSTEVLKSPVASTLAEKPASTPKNDPPKKEVAASVVAPIETAQSPYSTNPESSEVIDAITRAALVNIICMPQSGTLRPISGSGVIIDPRGVILTNAHVAQFVLLSQSSQIDLTCSIRTGSPAEFRWKAKVLYIPPIWVNEHYKEINSYRSSGTGEHDYALLLITEDMQGNAPKLPLPFLSVETREKATFEGDSVLVAGYPSEFVGGLVTQQNLYAATSISTIKQQLTFSTNSIDVFSVGGVIEAQGGSSGGAVVNPWRKLVAIITTTSEGATTGDRQLHTLSLNYIHRDFISQTSKGLETILSADVVRLSEEFSRETTPSLLTKYIEFLTR